MLHFRFINRKFFMPEIIAKVSQTIDKKGE